MKAVIIIPTYNEKENIAKLIKALNKEFKQIPEKYETHILVVDDTSPDGTAEIVRKLMKRYSNLHLFINAEKKGLGAAYIKGMKYAMDKLGADLVFEFDADGSHQPKYIKSMLNEISQGADVVVGSRYIPGGTMPADWGFDRKIISFFGNFIARSVFWTWQYRDMTSGFRVTKTSFLKNVDLDNLLSKQFAYKLHLYYALHKLGAKIVEYPIDFFDRTKGKTKFPKNNIKDSLRVVFTLRLRESQKFIKFGTVGFIGYLVNAFGLAFFANRGFPEWSSWLLSTELAIISNFTWNNLWTFKDDKFTKVGDVVKKFLQFNLTSAGALGIQTIAGTILTSIFGTQYRQLLLPVIIVFLVLPYNWLMYNKIIWKKKKDK